MLSVGIEDEEVTVFKWDPDWPAGFGALVEQVEAWRVIVGLPGICFRARRTVDGQNSDGRRGVRGVWLTERSPAYLAVFFSGSLTELKTASGSSLSKPLRVARVQSANSSMSGL